MKRTRPIFISLLLLSGVVARADTDTPYGAIMARNVFALVPIPTNPPPDTTPDEPPPKITPNGIMNIFGKLQALFKVAEPPKAGQPPHDESYVLTEGEAQDEIEVTKINEKAGTITFNNHGVVQELPLVSGVASSGAAPAGGGPGSFVSRPGIPGGNNFGGRFGRNPNLPPGNASPAIPTSPSPNDAAGGGLPSFGSAGTSANNVAPEEPALSPEAQVLLIEKNRLDTQEQVNQGLMPPLPPTAITPKEATAAGGSSLIVDPGAPPGP
jgi:hypothetical protein